MKTTENQVYLEYNNASWAKFLSGLAHALPFGHKNINLVTQTQDSNSLMFVYFKTDLKTSC